MGAWGVNNMRILYEKLKKGQDRIDPARPTCSLKDWLLFDEAVMLKLSSFTSDVNSQFAGIWLAVLMSKPYSLKMPLAGFEPASTASSERSFIQLSYRGILSNKSTRLIYNQIIDYKSNIVKEEFLTSPWQIG